MYHPRVFKKNINHTEKEYKDTILPKETQIPETTLYEESMVVHKRISKKYITVFGFSQSNLENVIRKVKEVSAINNIGYGKNYINISCLKEKKVLELNHTKVEGEIIGVYRQVQDVVDDEDIFVKKEGLMSKILIYIFGE